MVNITDTVANARLCSHTLCLQIGSLGMRMHCQRCHNQLISIADNEAEGWAKPQAANAAPRKPRCYRQWVISRKLPQYKFINNSNLLEILSKPLIEQMYSIIFIKVKL